MDTDGKRRTLTLPKKRVEAPSRPKTAPGSLAGFGGFALGIASLDPAIRCLGLPGLLTVTEEKESDAAAER